MLALGTQLERTARNGSRFKNTVLAHKTAPHGLFALSDILQKTPSQTVFLLGLEINSGRGTADVR
jgi:hypothetical protein